MIIFRPNLRLSLLLQLSFFLTNTKQKDTYRKTKLLHLNKKLHTEWAKRQRNILVYLAAGFRSRRGLIGGPATKEVHTEPLPATHTAHKRASCSTHQAWITHCLTLDYTISEKLSPSNPAHCPFIGFAALFFDSCFAFLIVIIPFWFPSLFFFFLLLSTSRKRSNYFPVVLLNVKCLKLKSVPCWHGARWTWWVTALLVTFCT